MLVLCSRLCNSNIVVNPEYYTNYYFFRTERQQDPYYLDYHIIIRVTSIFKTPAILHRMLRSIMFRVTSIFKPLSLCAQSSFFVSDCGQAIGQ